MRGLGAGRWGRGTLLQGARPVAFVGWPTTIQEINRQGALRAEPQDETKHAKAGLGH